MGEAEGDARALKASAGPRWQRRPPAASRPRSRVVNQRQVGQVDGCAGGGAACRRRERAPRRPWAPLEGWATADAPARPADADDDAPEAGAQRFEVAALRPHSRGDRRRPLQDGARLRPLTRRHVTARRRSAGPARPRHGCAASSKRLASTSRDATQTRCRRRCPPASSRHVTARSATSAPLARGKPAMVRRSSTARRLERRQNAVLMLIREQEEATADGFRDPSEDLELAGLVAPSGASGDLTSRRTEFSACATVTVDSRGGELGRLEDERSSLIGGDERSSCRASCRGQRSSVAGEGSKSRGAMSLASFSAGGSTSRRLSKHARKLSSESLPEETDELQALWDGDEEARRTGVDPSIREDDRATSFGTSCRDSARPSSVARHSFRVSFVGGAGGAPARTCSIADDGRSVVRTSVTRGSGGGRRARLNVFGRSDVYGVAPRLRLGALWRRRRRGGRGGDGAG